MYFTKEVNHFNMLLNMCLINVTITVTNRERHTVFISSIDRPKMDLSKLVLKTINK
jgi:hypothetical protein